MISTIAGIISAVGKFFSFTIRNPVASIRKPPQALKSLIMPGVVNGKIAVAAKKSIRKMIRTEVKELFTTQQVHSGTMKLISMAIIQ